MARRFLFSSEHVSEGHPDKLADMVSDTVLDACLREDPGSRVACETATTTGLVLIFGEITTKANVQFQKEIRQTVAEIGYTNAAFGLDASSLSLQNAIEEQSPDIAQGVGNNDDPNLGAGDQGLMIGYATNETPELMPATWVYARTICKELSDRRKSGKLAWARPDCKTQVTMEYEQGADKKIKPIKVHSVLVSQQHNEDISNEQIAKELKAVIDEVIPAKYMHKDVKYHLNPSGRFVIGGPQGDGGLTGRKIIVDTYGGWGGHGGGAFSGKDPTKVDRSAAYAARWVAKSLVAAGLCERCMVQVAYGIGLAEPLSLFVDSYGTGTKSDEELTKIVANNFSLTPYNIIKELDLRKPIYKRTASFGHFGREPDAEGGFSWEKPKQLKL